MKSARIRARAALAVVVLGTTASLAAAQEPAAPSTAGTPTGAMPPVEAAPAAQPPAVGEPYPPPPPEAPAPVAAQPAAPEVTPPAAAPLAGSVPPPPEQKHARPLGSPGVAFSVERVFGFLAWSGEDDAGKVHGSALSLLVAQPTGGGGTNPFALPRLAVDAFPIPGLSIGAAVGYFSTGGEEEPEGASSSDLPVTSGFLVAPRLGYAAMLSPLFGLWPRAGFTFLQGSVEGPGGEHTTTLQNLDLELNVVLSPAEHFAFTLGGVFDIGVAGTWKVDPVEAGAPNTKGDTKFSSYGATVGVVGYL